MRREDALAGGGPLFEELLAAGLRGRRIAVEGDGPVRTLHRDHRMVRHVAEEGDRRIARRDQIARMPRRVALDVDRLDAWHEVCARRERGDLRRHRRDNRRKLRILLHRFPLRRRHVHGRVRKSQRALGIHEAADMVAMIVADEDVGDACRIDAGRRHRRRQLAAEIAHRGRSPGVEQHNLVRRPHDQRLDRQAELVRRQVVRSQHCIDFSLGLVDGNRLVVVRKLAAAIAQRRRFERADLERLHISARGERRDGRRRRGFNLGHRRCLRRAGGKRDQRDKGESGSTEGGLHADLPILTEGPDAGRLRPHWPREQGWPRYPSRGPGQISRAPGSTTGMSRPSAARTGRAEASKSSRHLRLTP